MVVVVVVEVEVVVVVVVVEVVEVVVVEVVEVEVVVPGGGGGDVGWWWWWWILEQIWLEVLVTVSSSWNTVILWMRHTHRPGELWSTGGGACGGESTRMHTHT